MENYIEFLRARVAALEADNKKKTDMLNEAKSLLQELINEITVNNAVQL